MAGRNINNEFKVEGAPRLRTLEKVDHYGPEHGFRPDTPINPAPMAFFLNAGGLGDYLNYAGAILWVAKNCPWVHGTVYVSSFLREFLSHIFRDYPNWSVQAGERVQLQKDVCFAGPDLKVGDGQVINHQLLNATGAHLFELGFAYYANKSPAPADATLPYVSFPEKRLHFELRPLIDKYIVFTPGAIVPSRAVYGRHLNDLVSWVKERGYLPVFLGKNEVTPDLNPVFPDDIDYSAGLDLRNKTTITEAAAICQYSRAVVGLDNGLLWLASLTDANVLFAYNIAGPVNRRPRRHPDVKGRLFDINLTEKELACANCQDKWKLLIGHTFHTCIYSDLKCIDLLFADGGMRFRKALEELGV